MSKQKPRKEAQSKPEAGREAAAEHERFVQTHARLNSAFREVRDRAPESDAIDQDEELPGDPGAWEEVLDGAEADAASIPDLGDSISRIRARLRERIQAGSNTYPSV